MIVECAKAKLQIKTALRRLLSCILLGFLAPTKRRQKSNMCAALQTPQGSAFLWRACTCVRLSGRSSWCRKAHYQTRNMQFDVYYCSAAWCLVSCNNVNSVSTADTIIADDTACSLQTPHSKAMCSQHVWPLHYRFYGDGLPAHMYHTVRCVVFPHLASELFLTWEPLPFLTTRCLCPFFASV